MKEMRITEMIREKEEDDAKEIMERMRGADDAFKWMDHLLPLLLMLILVKKS